MSETLRLRGYIAVVKKEISDLDTKISAQIILIRNLADPYKEDVENLKTKELKAAAEQLDTFVEQLREKKERLETLNKELGNG
ncbi:MAG: hypothetical protein PHE67_02600 [Campylobacterales bacterium]|nr:hypothetical protein [Campylobacterales bacterium]